MCIGRPILKTQISETQQHKTVNASVGFSHGLACGWPVGGKLSSESQMSGSSKN